MPKQKNFLKNPPKECDVCHSQLDTALYDAKTIYGSWAYLCTDCFNTLGIGLGIGRGQCYKKDADGDYIRQ